MDDLNQLELHILEDLWFRSSLPKFCRTAEGRKGLESLITKGYVEKHGKGITTSYNVTQKGSDLLDPEPIELIDEETDMEDEKLFIVADEANIWREILQTAMDNGCNVETAIAHADTAIQAYRERAADVYKEGIAFKKAMIAAHEKELGGGGVGVGEGGTIVPIGDN